MVSWRVFGLERYGWRSVAIANLLKPTITAGNNSNQLNLKNGDHMETSLNNLISSEDNQTLHDIAHLVNKVNRKWVVLNPLISEEIKNKYFSFFRDLGKLLDLFNKLGKQK